MTARLYALGLVFLGAALCSRTAARPERVPPREPLRSMPFDIGDWSGRDEPKFSSDVLAELGADDYVDRVYARAGQAPVGLYIGYYQSQRQGDAIHSPLNCLPGAGWEPTDTSVIQVPIASQAAPVSAKRVLITKGLDRQIVLYWYQSHGRSIASEYWSKFYLIYDALRLNRSDAALVRVTTPVLTSERSDQPAEQRTIGFVEALVPELPQFLPS